MTFARGRLDIDVVYEPGAAMVVRAVAPSTHAQPATGSAPLLCWTGRQTPPAPQVANTQGSKLAAWPGHWFWPSTSRESWRMLETSPLDTRRKVGSSVISSAETRVCRRVM